MFFANLTLAILISRLIALLIGTVFHEYMHNYIGWLMGDSTPAYAGKLSLNPLKHIYWPGFLMFVVLGFGILGTAPINPGAMDYPRAKWAQRLDRRQRFGIAVLAGPVGNLLVAAAAALIVRALLLAAPGLMGPIENANIAKIVPSPGQIMFDIVFWNVLLFLFNLIPLGALDGRYILGMFIPPRNVYQYESFQNQYGMFILLGLIMVSFVAPQLNLLGRLIMVPAQAITYALLGV